jgi:hypothetical protein
MAPRSAIVLALALSLSCACGGLAACRAPASWQCTSLSEELSLAWRILGPNITVELAHQSGSTKPWLGIGWSESGSMVGLDAVLVQR